MATTTVNPYAQVNQARDFLTQGVQGYGEQLKPYLLGDIGTALGRLNSIGALRSGGTTQALKDITQTYADRIGAYADTAAGNALGYGLTAQNQKFSQENLLQQQAAQRKASLLKAIGGVLGAGVGFLAAGPAGAAAGYKGGSALGGYSEPTMSGGAPAPYASYG
jgi:hypothetical protein